MSFEAHWSTTASPGRVWDMLCDGWRYPTWVVGAARIRAVDPGWPAPGSRIHHSVGLWPLLLDDHTESTAADPGRSLTLIARAKLLGRARIRLRLDPDGSGCVIALRESFANPPLSWLPRSAVDLVALPRNRECVRRLALLAERPTDPGNRPGRADR